MRCKFMGFREQGAEKRQEARGKRQEEKNNVYLIATRNAISRKPILDRQPKSLPALPPALY